MTKDAEQTAIVAMFDSLASAEASLTALHHEGLAMKRMSIDGSHPHTAQQVIDSVNAGAFLLLVHGTAAMIVHARAILGTTDPAHHATLAAIYSSRVATEIAPD